MQNHPKFKNKKFKVLHSAPKVPNLCPSQSCLWNLHINHIPEGCLDGIKVKTSECKNNWIHYIAASLAMWQKWASIPSSTWWTNNKTGNSAKHICNYKGHFHYQLIRWRIWVFMVHLHIICQLANLRVIV